jgi:cytochrome d ubiquinol oxidase subunit II
VAFANLFGGLPLLSDGTLGGGIAALLSTRLALAGGGMIFLAIVVHGALWLAGKTEGDVARRAGRFGLLAWLGVVVLGACFFYLCHKETTLFLNFMRYSWLSPVLLLVFMGTLTTGLCLFLGLPRLGWWSSSLLIVGVILFGIAGIYPVMLPSRLNPQWGVRVAAAASSPHTLHIMLGVTLLFVPLVIVYQAWVYWVMRGPARSEEGDGY